MTGKHVSPAQEREFWALISNGVAATTAADKVGMSRSWGWRMVKGLGEGPSKTLVARERLEEAQPRPKTWDELDGGVKDCLKFEGGFSLFCETFLLRHSAPWREDAARRVVAALQDTSERSFLVANMPPGCGKTTLLTHDIPAWLIAGGGLCDPLRGRAIRILLGSYGMKVATHSTSRLRRLLESPGRFYDKAAARYAELSLVQAFGRFKPHQAGLPWAANEFIVEQLEDVDLSEKEPTVQAASYQTGFLGERVELFVWDDLVTTATTRNVDVRDSLASWFEDEAETRLEPGGVGLLVGQRLGPDDLYRNRLDVTFQNDDGDQRRKYQHIVWPAHDEGTCDGNHRQVGDRGGCLLDAQRLPWGELQAQAQASPRKFRVLYQQLDVDPVGALISDEWLTGGTDREGFEPPGCWDTDRKFLEWPKGVGRLIDYVTVDPSAGNWWAFQWWAVSPEKPNVRYLIRGLRSKSFTAGDLLQFSADNRLTGVMEEWQQLSRELGHPITTWIIEANSAFKLLLQYAHFRSWRDKWNVRVIPHRTAWNKEDEQIGVEALLPTLYRLGLKRIPRSSSDINAVAFSESLRKELTTYPEGATTDLVMADWFGEVHMRTILHSDERREVQIQDDFALPPYLRKQQRVAALNREEVAS